MSSCKMILRWLMSGTLYSLCIVRKLPRLPVIKGFGLNRCNAKSEIWGYVSQLNTVCLEARDVFYGYTSPWQIFYSRNWCERICWENKWRHKKWFKKSAWKSGIYFPNELGERTLKWMGRGRSGGPRRKKRPGETCNWRLEGGTETRTLPPCHCQLATAAGPPARDLVASSLGVETKKKKKTTPDWG